MSVSDRRQRQANKQVSFTSHTINTMTVGSKPTQDMGVEPRISVLYCLSVYLGRGLPMGRTPDQGILPTTEGNSEPCLKMSTVTQRWQ